MDEIGIPHPEVPLSSSCAPRTIENIDQWAILGSLIKQPFVQRSTYSSTIAVPDPRDLLDIQSLAQVLEDLLGDRIHRIWRVLWKPSLEIDFIAVVIVDIQGITLQDIRDDGEESTRGEAVRDELDVLVDAEDVAEDEDGFFGRVGGGPCEVDVNCWRVGTGSACDEGGLEWKDEM